MAGRSNAAGMNSNRCRKETGGCQTACKPGSVRILRCGTVIPLGHALLRASRDQPGRRGERPPDAARDRNREPTLPPLFGLAPGGVCPAAAVAGSAVRSCRTVSPLPAGWPGCPGSRAGGLFSVALSLGSPPPAVSRHRSFVEPGLSSTTPGATLSGNSRAAATVRPSGGRTLGPRRSYVKRRPAPTGDAAHSAACRRARSPGSWIAAAPAQRVPPARRSSTPRLPPRGHASRAVRHR